MAARFEEEGAVHCGRRLPSQPPSSSSSMADQGEEEEEPAIPDILPGACGSEGESALLPTESYQYEEEPEEDGPKEEEGPGSGGDAANGLNDNQDKDEDDLCNELSEAKLSEASSPRKSSVHSIQSSPEPEEEEYLNSPEWKEKEKHVFILSEAGKPIYSRYGSEDKLVTIFGVMQALVSFVQDSKDSIRSIRAGDTKFVFVSKGPIILVSVCRTSESVPQVVAQMNYVYNQIVSVLTSTQLNQIYSKRRNYDLRRLLSGSERLIDHLLGFMERDPAFLLGAVKCLPLASSIRDAVAQAIVSCCSKIKNLVFAILVTENQLVTLVRIKKCFLHPADLHLLFNLVSSSESFKSAESWTPICLPKFEHNGFLHGHVSYLSEDCQACLLLLTVERDIFFSLSEAKQRIVEKLRRGGCLEAINSAMGGGGDYSASQVGVGDVRHFLYKSRSTAQYTAPCPPPIYVPPQGEERSRLLAMYQHMHHRIHASRPLKLLFRQQHYETLLGWVTSGFELYVVFEPLVTKMAAINAVNKILRWMKKEEDRLFILNAPTF